MFWVMVIISRQNVKVQSVTAFIKKGTKKEASQLINAKSPDATPKSGSANTSTGSIAQSEDSVKRNFPAPSETIRVIENDRRISDEIRNIASSHGIGIVEEDLSYMGEDATRGYYDPVGKRILLNSSVKNSIKRTELPRRNLLPKKPLQVLRVLLDSMTLYHNPTILSREIFPPSPRLSESLKMTGGYIRTRVSDKRTTGYFIDKRQLDLRVI